MNFQAPILPFNLEEHVNSYVYDEGKFYAIETAINKKILDYDKRDPDSEQEGYGHFLLWHLNRTSKYLKEFMLSKGYDSKTADVVCSAFKLHDSGKILQETWIWELTEEKPDQAKKDLRREHTGLGKSVLFQTIEELGMDLNEDDFSHIKTIVYLMEAHHERLDGKGPLELKGHQVDEILKMIAVIDEIDGKVKLYHETLEDIFTDMRSKNKGRFDLDLVEEYYADCIRHGRYADLSAIKASAIPAPTL